MWDFSYFGFGWGTDVWEVGCRRCWDIPGWFVEGCGVGGCAHAFAVASVYCVCVVVGGVFRDAIVVHETALCYWNGGAVLIYSISWWILAIAMYI